jgi:hypothetical protein
MSFLDKPISLGLLRPHKRLLPSKNTLTKLIINKTATIFGEN